MLWYSSAVSMDGIIAFAAVLSQSRPCDSHVVWQLSPSAPPNQPLVPMGGEAGRGGKGGGAGEGRKGGDGGDGGIGGDGGGGSGGVKGGGADGAMWRQQVSASVGPASPGNEKELPLAHGDCRVGVSSDAQSGHVGHVPPATMQV